VSKLDVLLEAYGKFHELRVNGSTASLGEMLGFDYPDGAMDMAYGWQEPDFTRELVNAHNHFVVWLNRLGAWEHIIAGYPEDDAYSLTFEFVELPADYCLHFPYRFKQRIAFCATQLCYTAGIAAKALAARFHPPRQGGDTRIAESRRGALESGATPCRSNQVHGWCRVSQRNG
jgi:hypothetical protein